MVQLLFIADERPKPKLVEYNVNMPQRGELYAVKVLNDPKSVLAFLNGDTDKFLTGENFQRKFMHEYPKLLWNFEKVEDIGDIVLLFPNPAKVETSEVISIDMERAEENFDKIFDTPYLYPFKKKFLTALKEAYNEAFLDLDMLPSDKMKEHDIGQTPADPNSQNPKKDNPNTPFNQKGARSPVKGPQSPSMKVNSLKNKSGFGGNLSIYY